MVLVLPAPPQIHPAGRAGGGDPVGVDQRAIHDHMRVTGGLGCEQRPVQGRTLRGQHRDPLVSVVVNVQTAHGRREVRTLRVVTIAAGIEFPHAAQAIQVTPRTCPVSARTGKRGRWRTETVYAITDLPAHQARPAELAASIRGHWQIENGLHWVRDVTFAEDLSPVRAGQAPQVMASLRNLVISLHRLAGATNIAAALRHHARDARRPLQLILIN